MQEISEVIVSATVVADNAPVQEENKVPADYAEVTKAYRLTGKKRPPRLDASVYCVLDPNTERKCFVTISDYCHEEGTPYAKRVPFELFINTKETSAMQWYTALTTAITNMWRTDTFSQEFLKDLIDTKQPNGGFIAKGHGYVDSLVGLIGRIIASHYEALETINSGGLANSLVSTDRMVEEMKKKKAAKVGGCPECGGELHREEGCTKCGACGYSKCG